MPYSVDAQYLLDENEKIKRVLSLIRLADNESHFASVFSHLSDEAAQMTIKQVLNCAEATCIINRL